jgi:hypothetical protein
MGKSVFSRDSVPNIINMEFSGQVSEDEMVSAVADAKKLVEEQFSGQLCLVILVDEGAKYVVNPKVIQEFQSLMDLLPLEKGGLFMVSPNPAIGYLGQHLKGLVRRFGSFDEAQQFTNKLVRTRLSNS